MNTGTGGAGGADSSTTPGGKSPAAPVIALFDAQADLKTCAQKNHSRFLSPLKNRRSTRHRVTRPAENCSPDTEQAAY